MIAWSLVLLARLIGGRRSWTLVLATDGLEIGTKARRSIDSASKAHTTSCSAGTDSAPDRTPRVKDSITEGVVEQYVEVPTPKDFQEHVEVVSLTPHECMQRFHRSKFLSFKVPTEHIVDVPSPLLLEEIVEVVCFVPQARVQRKTNEHTVMCQTLICRKRSLRW